MTAVLFVHVVVPRLMEAPFLSLKQLPSEADLLYRAVLRTEGGDEYVCKDTMYAVLSSVDLKLSEELFRRYPTVLRTTTQKTNVSHLWFALIKAVDFIFGSFASFLSNPLLQSRTGGGVCAPLNDKALGCVG